MQLAIIFMVFLGVVSPEKPQFEVSSLSLATAQNWWFLFRPLQMTLLIADSTFFSLPACSTSFNVDPAT